jgi:SnoaL-like domain
LSQYGHLVDARDWQGLGGLFSADAVFDATVYGMPAARGAQDIVEFFAAATHPAAHHSSNMVISEDGPVVRVRSKWVVGNLDGTLAGGDYDDQVVREGTAWHFSERVVTRRWPEARHEVRSTASS